MGTVWIQVQVVAQSSLGVTSFPTDVRRVTLCSEEETEARRSSVITWALLGPGV